MTVTKDTTATTTNETTVKQQLSASLQLQLKSPSSLMDVVGSTPATPVPMANQAAEVAEDLSETFYIDNRRKQNVKIQVKLSSKGVYLRRETEEEDNVNEQLIRIDDIIGSHCGKRLKKSMRGGLSSCKNPGGSHEEQATAHDADASAYLYIYAYLKKTKPMRRVKTLRILRFRSSNDYTVNLNVAELWQRTIRQHKQNACTDYGSTYTTGKQLLILLNPKSGSGKGRETFQKQVAPVLREAEIPYDLQITTHPNYAQNFVRQQHDLLERYAGIVVASGDGLFYEVLNGLMQRSDWQRACLELPLGIIPCGSGNGLAKSVAHHSNEPYEPKPLLHATLNCIAGSTTPMDVVRVELAQALKRTVMYSFLSIGWGLIADIDIESETLRSIGAQRFTLWAIRRVITLRSYHGKLYYLPGTAAVAAEHAAATAMPKVHTAQTVDCAAGPNGPELDCNEFKDWPDEEIGIELCADDDQEDQFNDALSTDRVAYRTHTDSWHSAVSRRTTYYSIGRQSSRSSRNGIVAQRLSVANTEEQAERSRAPPPMGTIPTLHQPLDATDGWLCEEGDFVMVHSASVSHLASDCFFAPDSRLNDGLIYLVIIRAGVSRSQVLNFLLSMNTGTHLPTSEDPYICVKAVRAFRIEPSTAQNGIITVDGERVDYGPIQAEIIPGLVKVMTTKSQSLH